ncbi:MAG: bile acid beta-glucosidase [Tildeniella torsiva UHER 1998/13D]|nr:bile acid beta-glucosidase [Tildeniella torsiva UHER 1998/13D]
MTETPSLPQIPSQAWQRPIGQPWEHHYIVRYASNLDNGPDHGAPLGGMGAGCVGRSPNGDFNLWHMDGGEHVFQSFPGCQFSLWEQGGGRTQAYALSTKPPEDDRLSSWSWYPASTKARTTGSYHALYPRSWYRYENVFRAQITCEQISPIWPDNYKEASYPAVAFEWTAHNPTTTPITLSIMVSWQNMVGWFTNTQKSPEVLLRDDGSPYYDYVPALGKSTGNFNQFINADGLKALVMDGAWQGDPKEGDGQWCIAALDDPNVEVSYDLRWNPAGDGRDLWDSFAKLGRLMNLLDTSPAEEGEQIGGAIALRFTLQPGETRQIPVALAWDLPVTEFAAGVNNFRRYTDFYGKTGRNARAIAFDALTEYKTWQQHITAWQQPIFDRFDLPDWFKMALFNELYDLASGGTLWSATTEADPVGQFAVLECIDYRWYESLDVRLYGGFATLLLWPELEKAVLRAFARAIPAQDERRRIIGYYVTMGLENPPAIRKLKGATPHDLGAPNEHPWAQTNYTSYQDCNLWKDLGSDFVLQVYRAYQFTGATDVDFLKDCWPAVVDTLQYLKQFDRDGDGIPENEGAPDQTFDDWQLKGISAYCGGLWLGAMEAAIAIADILTNHNLAPGNTPILLSQYRRWLDNGLKAYHPKLWNGRYYRLDTGSGSDVVMADQLCGQFMVRHLGLPDLVEDEFTLSALDAIYDACFVKFNQVVQSQERPPQQKFEGAQLGNFSAATLKLAIGAANGVLPDGSPEDPDSTHQQEVWIGINFGLAAFFAQMGKREEAMAIADSVIHQIYAYGLQFRTPEAITALGTYRACHYMRPMAIWGLYDVLTASTDLP